MTFPTAPTGADAPYWVLGTDYQNYAVVYSCVEFGGFASARTVWILTRDPEPEERILRLAYDNMDAKRITRTFLMKTDQKNCSTGRKATANAANEIPDDIDNDH